MPDRETPKIAYRNRSSEIEAVIRRFLAARTAHDVESIRNLHSKADSVRLIGSDPGDWYQGYDQVTDIWAEEQEWFESVDFEILRIEGFENGTTAWAAVEQERTLVSGQKVTFRVTMVLVLEDSVWKIVQFHFSFPVRDEEVRDVHLTRTLSDLLTSFDSGSESLTTTKRMLGTTTVLFTDLVGSTSLSQQLGDRAWSDLIASHFQSVASIVEEEGGTEVKTLGDGGMYVFNSAAAALSTGIRIQRALTAVPDQKLRLRVGIHTGDVIQNANDYIGLTVNKAARVAAAADGGQILVSSVTAGMVNSTDFVLGDPFAAELKGIDGVHMIQQLDWIKPPNR